MMHIDLEFRDFLAEKIPKSIPNLNFSSHLEHANPNADPIEAALFFKNIWSKKVDLFKNNFLVRNEIFHFKKQLTLAERRLSKVRKGHQLILSVFENFDKNAFFFQEAQYLLKTYYEDIDMFQSHFYPESAYQNSGLLAVPTIKNEPEILIVREFTAETLEKNDYDAIKTDQRSFLN